MVRFFLLFSLFLAYLWAANSSEILKRADSYMVSGNQSNQFRAYNDYKNLYLNAMVENDSNLKLQAIRGIVKSGTALSIDVSKYSQELQELTAKKTSVQEPKNSKIDFIVESKEREQSKKDLHIDRLHKLDSVNWSDDKLILSFDQEMDDKQIKYFTLHEKSKKKFLYIFDIKTAMLIKAHNLNRAKIERIKLSQFDPESIRLVVQSNFELDLSYKTDSKTLEINFESKSGKSSSVAQTAPEPVKKRIDKTIVIDAGHGGEDPGAIGYDKHREKDIVFEISKELEKILKSRGYKIYMTRSRDTFIKLKDRTKLANDKSANIFISIHANAVDEKNAKNIQGIECFFLSPSRSDRAKNVAAQENSADMSDMNTYGKDSYLNLLNHHHILASNKLAIDVQRGMLGEIGKKYKGVNDNGVKEGPFWVLVGAQMPSVLIEVGFITHPQEGKRLGEDLYRKTLAKGIADGVERYFANN